MPSSRAGAVESAGVARFFGFHAVGCFQLSEGVLEPGQVLGVSGVDEVEVEGGDRGAMERGAYSADHDEFHSGGGEGLEEPVIIDLIVLHFSI